MNFNFRCNISTTLTLNDTFSSFCPYSLGSTANYRRHFDFVGLLLSLVALVERPATSIPLKFPFHDPLTIFTTPSDIRCRNSPSHVSVYIYALWKFNIKFMTYQTVLRFRSYVNASTDLRLKMKLKSIEQLFILSIYGWNWKESQKVFGMR